MAAISGIDIRAQGHHFRLQRAMLLISGAIMSVFSFHLHNCRRCRFYVSAAVAASVATVLVGAMEIYVSAPTNAAVVASQPGPVPSPGNMIEGVPRL
jgi:hypothetical protein